MRSAESPLRAALRRPSLRRLTLGFFALTLGEWILGAAAAISLFDDHGAIAVALVGARFIPAAGASVALSHLADHRRPSTVMAGAGAARAALGALLFAAVAAGAELWWLAALIWLDAAAGAAYRPAQARSLPSIARSPAELASAATLISSSKSGGQMLGALIGSVSVAVGGIELGIGFAFACFAVTAASAVGLRERSAPAPAGRPVGLGLRQGLLALKDAPGATRIAAWSCARSVGRGAWTSLGVLAALVLLHMDDAGYGALMAAAGVGTLVGISLSSRFAVRRLLAAPFALALAAPAVAFLLIGGLALPAVALAAMVLWGAGMALSDIAAQALLTRVVPPSQSARVTGVMEGAKLLAEGTGGLLAPLVAGLLGLGTAFIVAGCVLIAALLLDLGGFRRIDRIAVGRVDRLNLVRAVPWFGALRVDGLEAVVAPMHRLDVAAGTELITQDASGSRWYLVEAGRFDVFVDGFPVGHVEAGGSFGERGLMREEPRSATVRAATAASVLVLERDDFLRALTGSDATAPGRRAAADADPATLLRRQPLLHRLDDPAIARFAGAAELRRVPAETVLFAQGDPAEDWLVIVDGSVAITVDGEPRRTLGAGDALGEIAVLHAVPRTATARTLTDATVLVLPGELVRAEIELVPQQTVR